MTDSDPPSTNPATEPAQPVPEASGTPSTTTSKPKSADKDKKSHVVSTIVTLVVIVLGVVLLRTFVVETYYIPSASMEPTLAPGERIIVNKISYKFTTPQRNDVVVFNAPAGNSCQGQVSQVFVKRIIGLPGERISGTGTQPLIDGQPVPVPYWVGGTSGGPNIKAQVIPPNDYFVMGDNRGDSCDSRYWGVVPRSAIIGKAEYVIWPLSKIASV